MRSLLDINVLIALLDPDHVFHQRAHDWWGRRERAWASCPLTENGVIRIMSSPSYSQARQFVVMELVALFRVFTATTDHVFWIDSISLRDEQRFSHEQIVSSKQLTDVYLLALSIENGGRLVTFDQRIPRAVVANATTEQLCVL